MLTGASVSLARCVVFSWGHSLKFSRYWNWTEQEETIKVASIYVNLKFFLTLVYTKLTLTPFETDKIFTMAVILVSVTAI